jgi:hypothetical protein
LQQVVEAAAPDLGLAHAERLQQAVGRGGRLRRGGGEVELDLAVLLAGDQDAAAGREADLAAGGPFALLPERVRARQGGVPAQRDLGLGGEPAERQLAATIAGVHEGRLGEVHLGGDRLHPLVVDLAVEQADRRRVAAERPVGEGVDLEQLHSDPLMARNMAVSSGSAGGSTRRNQ